MNKSQSIKPELQATRACYLGDVFVYTRADTLRLIADAVSSVKRELLDAVEKEYPEMLWAAYSNKWRAFRKKQLEEK